MLRQAMITAQECSEDIAFLLERVREILGESDETIEHGLIADYRRAVEKGNV